MFDAEKVKDFSCRMIYDVIESFRSMVKGRDRCQDNPSQVSDSLHQLEVTFVQWCLSHHQDQPALLLQGYIRGPDQQIFII